MSHKNVYTIVKKEGLKPFWLQIGTCVENKDDSWNVYLNALPLDGMLNIRTPKAPTANVRACHQFLHLLYLPSEKRGACS
jgi:hypothetical protein